MEGLVDGDVFEALAQSGDWPPDFDFFDDRGFADSDVLAHGVAAEAGDCADFAIDGALAARLGDGDLDAGSEGGAVGIYTFEDEGDGMVSVAGIVIEDGHETIARKGAAEFFEDSSLPVFSMSAKAMAWPFWRLPKPPEVVTS